MTEPSSPLQIADFRRYWLSRFLASFATTGMIVILGYQLYDVARGDYGMSVAQATLMLSLFGFVQFVPMLLLTPISGVIADRNERRTVAAVAIGIDLLIAVVLVLATANDLITLPLLMVLGTMHGAARVFFGPALSSIPPNVVPAEILPRAIAMSSLAWQSASIAGPVVAGLLFAWIGYAPYAIAAGSLALSILLLLAIRPIHPPADNRKAHPYQQALEGFRFVRSERFLLGCITLDLFAVLLGGATALLPVFARDILHVGPEGLGQMRAAIAGGAVVTGLVLAVKPITHNVGVKMLAGVGIYGAATLAFGLSHWFPFSLAMLALLGAADMVSVFIRNSLVQLNTPDAVRGRVQAISSLAISASNELGEAQSGLAAFLLGRIGMVGAASAVGAVVIGGAGAILVTALWAVIFPELIRAKTFAPQYRQKEPLP